MNLKLQQVTLLLWPAEGKLAREVFLMKMKPQQLAQVDRAAEGKLNGN